MPAAAEGHACWAVLAALWPVADRSLPLTVSVKERALPAVRRARVVPGPGSRLHTPLRQAEQSHAALDTASALTRQQSRTTRTHALPPCPGTHVMHTRRAPPDLHPIIRLLI